MKCARESAWQEKEGSSFGRHTNNCLPGESSSPGDVPDIIGCLCARQERDALASRLSRLKRLKSIPCARAHPTPALLDVERSRAKKKVFSLHARANVCRFIIVPSLILVVYHKF